MKNNFQYNTIKTDVSSWEEMPMTNKAIRVVEEKSVKALKIGIWLYFFLLIFEGALRKWGLPAFSAPLLVIRDPLAIWLIYSSWKRELFPSSIYLKIIIVIGIIGMGATLVFGHGNLSVALFGARILLLHFPLMFIIGEVFKREDVLKIGKVLLWLSIPLVIITALQFYSPQSDWVNRGVGGDMEGSGFSGAMGYFRPSGTFSFTSGNSLFFNLVACFVLYFWVSNTKVNRLLLLLGTIAVLASIPLSISRYLFFAVGVALVFTLIGTSRKPEYLSKMLGAVTITALLLAILAQTTFFQTATEAFTSRFETASKIEGGLSGSLLDRYFGGMLSAITETNNLPFFGFGLGMGTNAGSAMLTGDRAFLIAEGEWARIIGEMGFLLGMGIITVRLGFCLELLISSYRRLKQGDLLPWILLSFALLIIPQGQWAQPTSLGFSTIIGGLVLASLHSSRSDLKSS